MTDNYIESFSRVWCNGDYILVGPPRDRLNADVEVSIPMTMIYEGDVRHSLLLSKETTLLLIEALKRSVDSM